MGMKLQRITLALTLLLPVGSLFGQTNKVDRLFIPFFDKESQSNIDVAVSDFREGQLCTEECTNVISNTNLFTVKEHKMLEEVLEKYKHYLDFTTNSGPSGAVLVSLYKTNVPLADIHSTNPYYVALFRYTNSDANETIWLRGRSISTSFRTKERDGYDVGILPMGGGLMLQFLQVKEGKHDGLFAVFVNSILEEYRRYSNEMVIGKYFMWNPRTGRLLLKADFTEPYDIKKHMIPLLRDPTLKQPTRDRRANGIESQRLLPDTAEVIPVKD
jgi:hypothetical protein